MFLEYSPLAWRLSSANGTDATSATTLGEQDMLIKPSSPIENKTIKTMLNVVVPFVLSSSSPSCGTDE